jgi:hypothetical protein
MKRQTIRIVCSVLLAVAMMALPMTATAQQRTAPEPGPFSVLGSVVLSMLYVPFKLATCAWTQSVAAVAYVVTYRVGDAGEHIGEVASGSCAGDWVITPSQLAKDYQYR